MLPAAVERSIVEGGGLPRKQAYDEDSEYLYLNNIYDSSEEVGEALTSFLVRQSIFFAFYSRHTWANTNFARHESSVWQQEHYHQAQKIREHREEDLNATLGFAVGRHNLEMIQIVPEQHALH